MMVMESDVVGMMECDMGHDDQQKGHVEAKEWYLGWWMNTWVEIEKSMNFVQDKDNMHLPQTNSA